MSTTSSVAVVTTSAAVTTTALSTCGTPVFVVTRQNGWVTEGAGVAVLTGNSSALASLVSFTAARPGF
jgi:hypothetical protein